MEVMGYQVMLLFIYLCGGRLTELQEKLQADLAETSQFSRLRGLRFWW